MEDVQKQIAEISEKMEEYARYALPAYNGDDKKVKMNQYYEYRKQYTDLKNKLQNNEHELLKKNNKNISAKVFVNSYGEATKREITCLSYKRAQKKVEAQLLNFL